MRFSGTDRDDSNPAWFRLGQVDVTTTVLVLLVWVVTLLVWMLEPVSKPLSEQLVFTTYDAVDGEVWRLITWPWAHVSFELWDVIDAFLFGIFGMQLERQTGRRGFAILLGAALLVIPLAAIMFSQLLPGEAGFADLRMFALVVVLLFCAEHPKLPFFFGIPAWVIGGIIVALEVVNDISGREWIRLLSVLLAAFILMLVARKIDLLSQYDRVPDLRLPRRKRKGESSAPRARKPSGRSAAASPSSEKPKRPGPLWSRKAESEPAEIVQMPTRPRPQPVNTTVPDVSADDLALDALLDKIADGGMDSLTEAERASLTELTARRKGRPSS